MIVSIHQPTYFPWLGWLHKVISCDVYVFLDDVQLAKKAYQHRNIFLTNGGKEKFLSVGIDKKSILELTIKDVPIREDLKWQKEHLNFFMGNYSNHPHFKEVMSYIEPVFQKKYETLGQVLRDVTDITFELFDIKTKMIVQSEMDYNKDAKKSELVISLINASGCDTYLSGTGAKDYMEDSEFDDAGIKLIYQEFKHPEYEQLNSAVGGFVAGMSTLDMLFNIGIEESRKVLYSI